MPHVTFIHGLANKPPKDILLEQWLGYLAGSDGSGLDLKAAGVSCNMVYWADVLYKEPEPVDSPGEEIPADAAAGDDRDPGPDLSWEATLPPEERQLIDTMRASLEERAKEIRTEEASLSASERAIPLPKFMERRLMEWLLRDAHHYLYDSVSEPRPGERFRVQKELRDRFVEKVEEGNQVSGPHVVISHSMGTMIAYDCLNRVAETPKVDALITLGSPLGLSEVQDGWGKDWSKKTAFPKDRVPQDAWLNLFDRLDIVCAVDPKLANDYRLDDDKVIRDQRIRNNGAWRHSVSEYLARTRLRSALEELLGL